MQREALKYLYDISAAAEKIRRFVNGKYKKMIAFRNVLIHGYATIDPEIVWGVVESNLEDVLDCAQAALKTG